MMLHVATAAEAADLRFSRDKRRRKSETELVLPDFYCRKSGGANAPATRRFPVTCCPLSPCPLPPSLSRSPRDSCGRAEPVPARSGRPFFLAGVPLAPPFPSPSSSPSHRIESLDSPQFGLLGNSHGIRHRSPSSALGRSDQFS